MLKIYTVLCRAGKMDNYAYILIDEATRISAVVDPSEAAPVVKKCEALGIRPSYVLNTHHHFDHVEGNLELKELYGLKIVGNVADEARIPGFDIGVSDGGIFELGESVAEIIDVSAHTQGHILYYFAKDKALFTGDTLFNLCVGGLFEGSVSEMFTALQKIKKLPDDVLFYPGHEYTFSGADVALGVLGQTPALEAYLQKAQRNLEQGLPAGPYSLGEEKNCNPYLAAVSLKDLASLM